MGSFEYRTISIAVVFALIVGAGAGYLVGNSPVSSLVEERGQLEAECDSSYLAFQSLETELDSVQELLVEGQRNWELFQERYLELISIEQENQVLNRQVVDLENQIEAQSQTMQSYVSTIEELENNIEQQYSQIDTLVTLNATLSEYVLSLEARISELESDLNASSSSSSQTNSTRTIIIDLIGTCTSVIDGDTFELSSGIRVRLADIDAPESYESGYYTSTNALSSWIQGETVYLDIDEVYETDIYGRYVCVVYVEFNAGYANVNYALLLDGYAALDNYPNEFNPGDWGTPGNLDQSEAALDTSSPELEPEPAMTYVGSTNSDKYHYPSCYWAQQIYPSNEIWFTTKADAEAHGYVPCKVCKP